MARDEDVEDLLEIVPVDDPAAARDEELPGSREAPRLSGRRARVAAAVVLVLVVGAVLLRALTAGSGSPAAAPTPTPATGHPNVTECGTFRCLHNYNGSTSFSSPALAAVHARYRGARIIVSESDLDASTGLLKYRRIVARDGLQRIEVIVRPRRRTDTDVEGFRDDGSGSIAYLRGKLGTMEVAITVTVPTGAIQLDLVPVNSLAGDYRLLALG